jgi:hypothetical protein
MNVHRKGLAIAVGGLLFALLPGAATGVVPKAAIPSDFNGDGYADLAIGAPGEEIGTKFDAGGVNVLYGSAAGITATGDQFWSQDSPGVLGGSEAGDGFGEALASGDFDRDGYADLAIGVPAEDIGTKRGAGAVNVLHGSSHGLTASRDQMWTQQGLGLGAAQGGEPADFGRALTAADFDGDGYTDLAISVYHDPGDPGVPAAEVTVLFGGADGLTATRATTISRATPGVPGDPRDRTFGRAIAAADFDADGHADLAIGADFDRTGDVYDAGAVVAVYGSASGFDPARSDLWTQDSPGVPDAAEFGDWFGCALATGDFDGDGSADLAIGVSGESATSPSSAGAVNVLYGSPAGLTGAGAQLWHQDVPGIPGAFEVDDHFGYALAAGDLDGDGADDLAIGVPREMLGSTATHRRQGAVTVLYGGSTGLAAAGAQSWTQDSPGVPGTAENADEFGRSLAIANYGRSRAADLAVGVSRENVGSVRDAGMVNVLYGRSTGLSGVNSQGWSQSSTGVLGAAEKDDYFGASLAP